MSVGTTEDPTTEPQTEPSDDHPVATAIKTPVRLGDRLFSGLTLSAGVLILLVLAGVALFLFFQALPYFTEDGALKPDVSLWTYTAPLVFGTVYAASLALIFAVIPAVAVALFISHYAPKALARTLGSVIDLLAAIPSVVYGLWGIFVLAPSSPGRCTRGSRTTPASSRCSRGPSPAAGGPCSPPPSCSP